MLTVSNTQNSLNFADHSFRYAFIWLVMLFEN